MLQRNTSKKKMRAKLKSVKTEMRRRMTARSPTKDAGSPGSSSGTTTTTQCPATPQLYAAIAERSSGSGGRRLGAAARKATSPGNASTDSRNDGYPKPRILHPWPQARFEAKTQGRSPVR